MKLKKLAVAMTVAMSFSAPVAVQAAMNFSPVSQYEVCGPDEVDEGGDPLESCTEISSYSKKTKQLFVTNAPKNRLQVIDFDNGILTSSTDKFIDLSEYGAGPNSTAVYGKWLAVAVEAEDKTHNGSVVIFDVTNLEKSPIVIVVGALPDMVTFTPNGKYIIVANEGEPNDDYDNDPIGSISIIKTKKWTVKTADFKAFNGMETELWKEGTRIFGPDASVEQDLEPEYVTVSRNSKTAWVTLQENNAIAEIDIPSATVVDIHGLGFKDHSLEINKFDASNDDDLDGNLQTWPTLGMYQPDAIASMEFNGRTFILTANEGDARDYDGYSEEDRVKDLDLDTDDGSFTEEEADFLQEKPNLGRLKTTYANGDTDGDGDYDQIYSYGARSFSIWNDQGEQVFDSGAAFEFWIAKLQAEKPDDETLWVEGRSDDKGPEPESILTTKLGGKIFAFIGMERTNDIFVYDVSNPYQPVFTKFVSLDSIEESNGWVADVGPEGLKFVHKNGHSGWLVVSSEISNTVSSYYVEVKGEHGRSHDHANERSKHGRH